MEIRQVTAARKRFYEYDQKLYPSVTTVLKAVPKPALVGWAAKVTAEWAVDNKKMWYGMDPDAAKGLIKKARFRGSEADLGSAVHAAVLEEAEPTARTKGFVEAFDDWQKDMRATRLAAEVPLVHVSDIVGYGGTADWIGTVAGERTLLDVKTGKAVYPEAWLQVEAYARCDVGFPGDWRPQKVAVLHLRDGQWDYYSEDLDPRRMAAFVGAYDVADYLGLLSPGDDYE